MVSENPMGRIARKALDVLSEPVPLRFQVLRALDMALDFLPYPAKINFRSIERPNYGHCLLHAARLARHLGHQRISAIEFGVAGGNGLVALERHALLVEKETGVGVQVYGFDTGTGMPAPTDYRDLPYLWQAGYFKMDVDRLRARLSSARLCIGPVAETVPEFIDREQPAPVGFVSVDVDYYSSTVPVLKLFEADFRYLLPRVSCYLDDMAGDLDWAYNPYTGELLAVNEFNTAHDDIKIAPVQGLRHAHRHLPQLWHEQVFIAHLFQHPDYGHPVSDNTDMPLTA